MQVLVTGSEGFIGSHLVEKLIRAGHVGELLYYIIPIIPLVG